jgi:hypothetical protein
MGVTSHMEVRARDYWNRGEPVQYYLVNSFSKKVRFEPQSSLLAAALTEVYMATGPEPFRQRFVNHREPNLLRLRYVVGG